jgi:hypothetical protein
MSHNNAKFANKSPNSQGEITVELNDLDDVSASSVSNGQLLKYVSSSSAWESANAPSGGSMEYIWAGGKAKAYSDSPATSLNSGQSIYIWDDAPVNTITGASISVTSGNGNSDENNWIQTITLPQGKYIFRGQTQFVFSASGYAAYCWHKDSTVFGNNGVVGESRGTTYGPSNSTSNAYFSVASSETFSLRLVSVSNIDTIASQSNRPSEFGLLFIEKVE